MRSSLRLSVLCVAGVLGGGCSSGEEAAPAECGDTAPAVALSRNGEYEGSVGVVVAARNGTVDLVTGDWVATEPSFSPDGERLVVVRAVVGDYDGPWPGSTELWVVRSDATEPRALTHGSLDSKPAWSPDGQQIVFSRQPVSGEVAMQLRVVSSRGDEQRLLLTNEGVQDPAPAWSPDGEHIAFIRSELTTDPGPAASVWVVDANGANARAVAAVPYAHSVAWHPDGESLLVSSFAREDGALSLVDVNTGEVRQIAEHAALAAWSSDGTQIYYFTNAGASQASWWRLARGRLVEDRLEQDGYVGHVEDYHLYRYFGLAVSPCG